MKPKPSYFSSYFKVDKKKLSELGTFDPILNFDTKLFVEPLLLKKSNNNIIREASKSYQKHFVKILLLLQKSKEIDDKCWKAAKKLVNFPEYQFTCIGYGSDSTDGKGS